jgi:hypothetical protein
MDGQLFFDFFSDRRLQHSFLLFTFCTGGIEKKKNSNQQAYVNKKPE